MNDHRDFPGGTGAYCPDLPRSWQYPRTCHVQSRIWRRRARPGRQSRRVGRLAQRTPREQVVGATLSRPFGELATQRPPFTHDIVGPLPITVQTRGRRCRRHVWRFGPRVWRSALSSTRQPPRALRCAQGGDVLVRGHGLCRAVGQVGCAFWQPAGWLWSERFACVTGPSAPPASPVLVLAPWMLDG